MQTTACFMSKVEICKSDKVNVEGQNCLCHRTLDTNFPVGRPRFSPSTVLVGFLVAVMHLQILFDSCHSTIASYSCIRGWALGLSEAAVPPPAIPPQGLKKGAFPTWTNEVSCHTEQCGNIL